MASIERSNVSSATWEALVVDNNSTDRTASVINGFCHGELNCFYVFEREPGKSRALNAGIRQARGHLVAFTDDDVEVDPKWLQYLTLPIRDGLCVGVAGRILPEKPVKLPRWLPEGPHALAPLALFDPPRGAGPLNTAPYGANMAFHKSVFEKYGGFRIDLGPQSGGSPQHGEDSEFGDRLLQGGE